MTGIEEGAALIWCPFPDDAAARALADALLRERLIACANMVPAMTSLFVWHGKRDESAEVGVLFKTTAGHRDAVMRRLRELHSYDAPAITGWTVAADPGTLAWMKQETGADSAPVR